MKIPKKNNGNTKGTGVQDSDRYFINLFSLNILIKPLKHFQKCYINFFQF